MPRAHIFSHTLPTLAADTHAINCENRTEEERYGIIPQVFLSRSAAPSSSLTLEAKTIHLSSCSCRQASTRHIQLSERRLAHRHPLVWSRNKEHQEYLYCALQRTNVAIEHRLDFVSNREATLHRTSAACQEWDVACIGVALTICCPAHVTAPCLRSSCPLILG